MRSRISIRGCVRPSVGRSVRRSVCPSHTSCISKNRSNLNKIASRNKEVYHSRRFKDKYTSSSPENASVVRTLFDCPSVRPYVHPSVHPLAFKQKPPKSQILNLSFPFFPSSLPSSSFSPLLYPHTPYFSTILSSEFKAGFRRRLRELNIKQYTVHTSIYPKISLIERLIKTVKSIYFNILYHFKTLSYANALQLATSIYNGRIHSALFNNSPWKTHFDSHTSSIVTRKTIRQFKIRQKKIYNFFGVSPNQTLKIGDKVLLKNKKKLFIAPTRFYIHTSARIRIQL